MGLPGRAHSSLLWDSRLRVYNRTVPDGARLLGRRHLLKCVSISRRGLGCGRDGSVPLFPGPQTTRTFLPALGG